MECVYLLQEKDFNNKPTGLYKIGRTKKDAKTRKRQYQAGNARKVDIYFQIRVTDSQKVETKLHHELKKYRCNYGGGDEWFDFSEENIKKIEELMQKYDETKEAIVEEKRPSSYYSSGNFYRFNILTFLVQVAIGGGLAFFIFRGFFHPYSNQVKYYKQADHSLIQYGKRIFQGIVQFNSNQVKYYNQAYHPLLQYDKRSDTGQYNTAAINFKKFADSTANKCLKNYGKNMAEAALLADKKLKKTKDKTLAWNEFRRWQDKAWDEADCKQEIKKLGS